MTENMTPQNKITYNENKFIYSPIIVRLSPEIKMFLEKCDGLRVDRLDSHGYFKAQPKEVPSITHCAKIQRGWFRGFIQVTVLTECVFHCY